MIRKWLAAESTFLAHMAFRNQITAAWLNPDNEPEKPLEVKEFFSFLVLLDEEPFKRVWASGSKCGVHMQQPQGIQVPGVRSGRSAGQR